MYTTSDLDSSVLTFQFRLSKTDDYLHYLCEKVNDILATGNAEERSSDYVFGMVRGFMDYEKNVISPDKLPLHERFLSEALYIL